MDKQVVVLKCENYDNCDEYIGGILKSLGGLESYIRPGMNVVIKPNLVSKKKPDEAVTTHPAVLRAVVKAVLKTGAKVKIAESPGGAYNSTLLKGLYSVCGVDEAVKDTAAELNFDTGFSEVSFHGGETVKSFTIIDPIVNADFIISLPKLKTHAMTAYTGGVKNLFGVIPGTHKAEFHFRLNERKAFCSMLVDLYECVNRVPVLTILDGIVGMEGNGPTAGKNRHLGVMLAGFNAHAVDLCACHIIGYKFSEVETLKNAVERNLIPSSVTELELIGDDIEKLRQPDFLKPESHFNLLKLISLPEALNARVVEWLSSNPEISKDRCVGCGECARCCPPEAIDMTDGRPVINKKKCIRCFCCQELCPAKAVDIKRHILNRLMIKLLK